MSTVVCEDDAKMNMLLGKPPSCLKRIIHIKEVNPLTADRAVRLGIELLRLEDVEKIGAAHLTDYPEQVRLKII